MGQPGAVIAKQIGKLLITQRRDVSPVNHFTGLQLPMVPRHELIKTAGAKKTKPRKNALNVGQRNDDAATGFCAATKLADEGRRIHDVLDAFQANQGVKFTISERQPLAHVGINIIRAGAIDVGGDRRVAALAQTRRQPAVAGGNVQDFLPALPVLDQPDDNLHVAGEFASMRKIFFKHLNRRVKSCGCDRLDNAIPADKNIPPAGQR